MTTVAPVAVVIPAAPIVEAREKAALIVEAQEEAAIPAAVQEAAPIAVAQEAVTPAAPEATAAPAAEVTWIWSGHRIYCSPAHVIDIYILRVP